LIDRFDPQLICRLLSDLIDLVAAVSAELAGAVDRIMMTWLWLVYRLLDALLRRCVIISSYQWCRPADGWWACWPARLCAAGWWRISTQLWFTCYEFTGWVLRRSSQAASQQASLFSESGSRRPGQSINQSISHIV